MSHFLMIFLQAIEPISKGSSVSFYVFVLVAILLIYIKLNKTSYLKNLANLFFSEHSQFDPTLQTNIGNISSGFLQLSYALLISLGISHYVYIDFGFQDYFSILFKLIAFYIILIGLIYIVSSTISKNSGSFIRNRLAFNEANALFLFLALLLSINLPIDEHFTLLILLCSMAINMFGATLYLQGIISIFHIILYLCMLEILPVLVLTKYF